MTSEEKLANIKKVLNERFAMNEEILKEEYLDELIIDNIEVEQCLIDMLLHLLEEYDEK